MDGGSTNDRGAVSGVVQHGKPYQDIRLGDIVRMRKQHPCGGYDWEVVRLGADIGIRCRQCSRRVLLPRSRFLRQVKALVSRTEVPSD